MADNDLFQKELPRPFWKMYKAAKGVASPEETIAQCPHALKKLLEDRGCPGIESFCKIVAPLCSAGESGLFTEPIDYQAILMVSEALAQSFAGSDDFLCAQVGARVCQDMAIEVQRTGVLLSNTTEMFTQRWCEEIVHAFFWDRLDQSKVMERFEIAANGDVEAAGKAFTSWKQEACELLPGAVSKLARELACDMTGQSVRAPQVSLPKRSTEDLTRNFRIL